MQLQNGYGKLGRDTNGDGVIIKKPTRGFTIVELLIVIVVIAVLAAITVVAYMGVQRSAVESSLKSDLRNGSANVAMQEIENGQTPQSLDESSYKVTDGNDYQYHYDPSNGSYCLTVMSSRVGGVSFHSENGGQIQSGSCSMHSTGALSPSNTWKQVSVGTYSSCGITRDDIAYCWGSNIYGGLGNDSVTDSYRPTPIHMNGALSGKTITKFSVGSTSVCAIASDAKVYCWGMSTPAGLGDGYTTVRTPTPISTANMPTSYQATDVSLSESGRGCLVADGKVYCWGSNSQGSLGDSTTTTRPTPVPVSEIGGIGSEVVKKVSVGYQNTCAVTTDHELYCWGGGRGNMNAGTTAKRNIPYIAEGSVFTGKTVQDVVSANAASCAIADYKIYCWGSETLLGTTETGAETTTIRTPTLIDSSNMGDYQAISLFGNSVVKCALTNTGTFCWGKDTAPSFEDESTGNPEKPESYTPVPVSVSAVSGFIYGDMGWGAGCVVGDNHRLYCWGRNSGGRLGTTTVNQGYGKPTAFKYLSPTLVLDP